MSFLDLARERYSCRKFSDKPVEAEKLEKILQAAILAPTAKNAQPVKIWLIQTDAALEKLREAVKFHFDCKNIIVVGADPKANPFVRPSDGKNFCEIDASIVATHIMLEIHDLGLASTWVGFLDEPKLKSLFPQMQAYEIVAVFPIGYPAEDAKPSERHTVRKPESELVQRL